MSAQHTLELWQSCLSGSSAVATVLNQDNTGPNLEVGKIGAQLLLFKTPNLGNPWVVPNIVHKYNSSFVLPLFSSISSQETLSKYAPGRLGLSNYFGCLVSPVGTLQTGRQASKTKLPISKKAKWDRINIHNSSVIIRMYLGIMSNFFLKFHFKVFEKYFKTLYCIGTHASLLKFTLHFGFCYSHS